MPNVTFDKTSNVTGRIAVTMTKQEINTQLVDELKKQRGNVNMKGFRKGKVPMSTMRKMFGNEVLGRILDNEIREALFGHIEENDLDVIFSPRPVDNDTPVITATTLQDLTLEYDLALAPKFDYKMPDEAVDYYVLDVSDEDVDEAVANMRKRSGDSEDLTEGTVQEGDVISVTFTEAGPVEDKITNSTKLYSESLTEEGKALFVGQEVGEVVNVSDLSTIEEESTEAYIRRYFLDVDADTDLKGKSFDVKIDSITRVTEAELDEDFFNQYDPSGRVTNEEELREDIRTKQSASFKQQADGMANFSIQKLLVEGTEMELPLEFMRELNEGEETDFENFERGVRWMIIRNKVADDEGIKLEYEDLRAEAEANLVNMLGGQRPDFMTDDFIDNYVRRALDDEEQRNQLSGSAIEKKIMAALREKVVMNEQALSVDDFNAVIKKFNEENAPPPPPAEAAAEEE